ncbi:MAG: aminoglycoside phosphotransferase family protein [Clostridia bacterium]|nr:aminoglycoside phosphotransferase family protein [Clostridia bacterium]
MNLFNEKINNWQDWGRVFQSIHAFEPLAKYIMSKESLPQAELKNLTPGTNAVFRAGDYVIKIFAPKESGNDQTPDMKTEIYASRRANLLGISAPKVIADGFVQDKYLFGYLITEYINGREFIDAEKDMTALMKVEAGRNLRNIADAMNTPCERFNDIDIFSDSYVTSRFTEFPESFRHERLSYIRNHRYSESVFVHGDLFGDNVLISDSGKLYIIDFADAVKAPICYEHALVAVDFFRFDKHLIKGFFGDMGREELIEICFNGILIHNFGYGVIKEHIGRPEEFRCLDDLRKKMYEKTML